MAKKIVVPSGMLKAALDARYNIGSRSAPRLIAADNVREIVEAALRWLSENPIAPRAGDIIDMDKLSDDEDFLTRPANLIVAFQRRMFLAPEPEVREPVKDIFRSMAQGYALTPAEADYIVAQLGRVVHGWKR